MNFCVRNCQGRTSIFRATSDISRAGDVRRAGNMCGPPAGELGAECDGPEIMKGQKQTRKKPFVQRHRGITAFRAFVWVSLQPRPRVKTPALLLPRISFCRYFGNPSATAASFFEEGVDSFTGEPLRWYRTGDLGQQISAGARPKYAVLGRISAAMSTANGYVVCPATGARCFRGPAPPIAAGPAQMLGV